MSNWWTKCSFFMFLPLASYLCSIDRHGQSKFNYPKEQITILKFLSLGTKNPKTKQWYAFTIRLITRWWIFICHCLYSHIVCWEAEGCYHYSTMFCWEPEALYHCTKSMAIVPFWFSTEHHWTASMPFWLSADNICFSTPPHTQWAEVPRTPPPCTDSTLCVSSACTPQSLNPPIPERHFSISISSGTFIPFLSVPL